MSRTRPATMDDHTVGTTEFRVRGGQHRSGPTFSNRDDCLRYGCPMTPWNWATRWTLERAELSGREVVADLGAGTNPLALAAYTRFARKAYMVDNMFAPSDRELSPHIQLTRADITDLPIPNESVDVVISISVLEHLPITKRLATMREAARVLRPGGRALISMANFFRVSPEAERQMQTLPVFVDAGCAVYFPTDIHALVQAAPCLRLAETDDLDRFPGSPSYSEPALLADPDLVLEHFTAKPRLAEHPALQPVSFCEMGLMFCKGG